MGEALAVLGLAVVAAGLVWAWRRIEDVSTPGPERTAWDDVSPAPTGTVTLDLPGADPEDPAVQRLVREAAHRALAGDRSLTEVEVIGRDGSVLGRERRPDPLPAEVAIPEELHEPHASTSHGPSVVPRADAGHPRGVPPPPAEVRIAPLADRLELPGAVRARIEHPDRATDVLRAILEAAGRPVVVDGDLVVTGDVAIAVVDPRSGTERALNHGFLRIEATAAPRGIILRLGYVDPALTRRRETAAPHVRHVGPDALQRMADAVAVGADPIAFAAGPVTIH